MIIIWIELTLQNKSHGKCLFAQVLEVSFAVSLYAYYFTEGNATFLLNALDLISYYQNNFNPMYQGVTISSLVIVPLAAILRIVSFVWFWLRRSEVSLYTVSYSNCLLYFMLTEISCYNWIQVYLYSFLFHCRFYYLFQFRVLVK